jgi:hypothetical protein
MTQIFSAMHLALVPEGVFVLWFAHKSGSAWSSTITALLDSGFTITALWGVRAEMEHSLHITGKAALRTNILMVCRKRSQEGGYIQDVLGSLESGLESRLFELEGYGIVGPDFVMGAQAEALKATSQRWPLKDPEGRLTGQQMLDLAMDKAVGMAVSHVIQRIGPQISGVDAAMRFTLLARHLYKGSLPYDDARRLALACLTSPTGGDPVAELVVNKGLGELTTESVSGERAKVLTLLDHVQRYREGRLSVDPNAPIIDHIQRAIALLDEGKTPAQAGEALTSAGAVACDVLNALYQIIRKPTPERTHIQTLLLTVCQQGIIRPEPKPPTSQPKMTDYARAPRSKMLTRINGWLTLDVGRLRPLLRCSFGLKLAQRLHKPLLTAPVAGLGAPAGASPVLQALL